VANPALLLLSGDGSLAGENRSGPLTAVGTGAVRYAVGKFTGSQALFVEEATTNRAGNPSAENADANIGTSVQLATRTRVTTYAAVGSASFQVVTQDTGPAGIIILTVQALSLTGARTIIATASVRGSGQFNARVLARYSDATKDGGAVLTFTAGGAFSRIVTPPLAVNPAKTIAGMEMEVYTSTGRVTTFHVDAAQIEDKSYATSYADGSLGTGYSWDGTAHGSQSSRSPASVSVAHADPIGSLALWYREAGEWTFNYAIAPGALGASSSLSLASGTLTVATTKALTIGPLMTFDRPLTEAEQSTLNQRNGPWYFKTLAPFTSQAIPFSGGPKRLARAMWRSNATNARLEDLTKLVTGASVSLDIDRTIPMTLTVELVDPGALVAYRDFLAPTVTITEIVSGTETTAQLGLFRIGVPATTRYPNAVTGQVDGEDMMSLLANSGVGAVPFNMSPADSYRTAIITQCSLAGITRTNMPPDARVVPAGKFHSWPPGTARCRIVFDLCRILGWLNPWSDGEGVITTKIVEEPGTQQPAITYRDGDGSSLVGVVTSQPAVTTLSNHIVVTQDNLQTGVVLTADRTNTDPSSPSSIPNIGERFRHESMTNAADQAAVDAQASRLVEQWGNVLQNVSLSSSLDPLRGVWESADIAIHVDRIDGGLVGRYRISGWDHDLSAGTTAVTLRRTEAFGKATQ